MKNSIPKITGSLFHNRVYNSYTLMNLDGFIKSLNPALRQLGNPNTLVLHGFNSYGNGNK